MRKSLTALLASVFFISACSNSEAPLTQSATGAATAIAPEPLSSETSIALRELASEQLEMDKQQEVQASSQFLVSSETLGWTYLPIKDATPAVIEDIKESIVECQYKPANTLSSQEFIAASLCMENAGFHNVERMNGVCSIAEYENDEICKQHIYDLYESGI